MKYIKVTAIIAVALSLTGLVSVASASHSWGGYHWARTANPFTLSMGDNVSTAWDSILATTSSDWSNSSILDTTIVAGQGRTNCRANNGRVEVCNKVYGNTGWLGIAQIWVSGSHITKGIVKVNDTYFNTPTYNTLAWRNLVMCQEVGHTLGLGHQDENFTNPNLDTCMDYTNDPSTNQHPNQDDYDMLTTIYAHLDSMTTVAFASASSAKNIKAVKENSGQEIDLDDPSAWGKAIKKDAQGKNSTYERDLGNGQKVFTFVTWAR
ncbi:MAG: hypothetical protein AAB628_02030 [Patescibacteria group bacterium]